MMKITTLSKYIIVSLVVATATATATATAANYRLQLQTKPTWPHHEG